MGTGSLAGAYKWTAIFKEHLRKLLEPSLDVLLAQINSLGSENLTNDEFLDKFALGFEKIKYNFNSKKARFFFY